MVVRLVLVWCLPLVFVACCVVCCVSVRVAGKRVLLACDERIEKMKALEWLAGRVLGWLACVALVLAGVAGGVGIFEHDWVLVGLGVGFAGVAWVLDWLDDMEEV